MLYLLEFEYELLGSFGHDPDRFVLEQVSVNMDNLDIVQLDLDLLGLVRCVENW